ncbi:3'-5' exonuclease [Sphingobacterium pedocola]|uniref:3'-5' exonuclease n=1 Tax=Sphingobacterium pedocola TaxID=2082722 RepID=UPI0021D24EBE|nr:3'-5' exonuclease [Sphingobacterium pedocola]
MKPEGFSIPMTSSNIHGITTERALNEGRDLKESLSLFSKLIQQSTTFIAHNISFDEKILGAEFLRKGMDLPLENKSKICTMDSTKIFCQIPTLYGYKKPKLSELYKKLFDSNLEYAHDASIDVEATAKCFWRLRSMGIL